MVVHIGVIMIAVALVASNSYTRSAALALEVGEERSWGGHTFELQEVRETVDERARVVTADVLVDGDRVYGPATTKYLRQGIDIGTPSVRTGPANLILSLWISGAGRRSAPLLHALAPSPPVRPMHLPLQGPSSSFGSSRQRWPRRSSPSPSSSPGSSCFASTRTTTNKDHDDADRPAAQGGSASSPTARISTWLARRSLGGYNFSK